MSKNFSCLTSSDLLIHSLQGGTSLDWIEVVLPREIETLRRFDGAILKTFAVVVAMTSCMVEKKGLMNRAF